MQQPKQIMAAQYVTVVNVEQESCAIAKMTAQCALYAHGYYSQHFSWAFVRIYSMNVPTKFEVRSFTRSRDSRGYPQKIGQSLDMPTLHFLQNF